MVLRVWTELEQWVKSSPLRFHIADAIVKAVAFAVSMFLMGCLLGALFGPFGKMPVWGYLGS